MGASYSAGAVVLGGDVRVLADVLGALFERDRELAVALNAEQRRLLVASERLTVSMPVGAVLLAVFGPADADLGHGGRRPPVLEGDSPMILSGLGKRYRQREAVPRIRKVHSTAWGDRVLVRLMLGQCTEDVERAAPELAHSFGARACRVREDRPGRLWLEFATGDPLTHVVPALDD